MTHLHTCDRTRIVTLCEHADLNGCMHSLGQHGAHCCVPVPLIHGFICLCDDEGAQDIAAHADVARVEEDVPVQLVAQSARLAAQSARHLRRRNSEIVPEGVQEIRAPQAWSASRGTGVGVAIIDTGIDLAHPDLSANIAGGVNFVNPRKSPQDDNGHGTHVAGTVAAVANTIGVVGVAPKARLYAVKVLNATGSGYISDVILGIQWAVAKKIPIVNMSLGTTVDIAAFRSAIQNAVAAGVTVVAAAGNEGKPDSVNYPGKYPEVIAVSAITSDGTWANFSSQGREVDLAAPGVSVLSTLPGRRYGHMSGTSMASPHVAGVAALYLNRHPGATPAQIASALKSSAAPLANLAPEQQGAGRVDALNAVLLQAAFVRKQQESPAASEAHASLPERLAEAAAVPAESPPSAEEIPTPAEVQRGTLESE